jgi:cobalt-precorrin 5A hydrolase
MIVAGFGFRARATMASFAGALAAADAPEAPIVFATLNRKADDLRPFAQARSTTVLAISTADAAAQTTLTASSNSEEQTGLGSVAEACALAAAGPGAKLLGPRVVSSDHMATCAIAVSGDAL